MPRTPSSTPVRPCRRRSSGIGFASIAASSLPPVSLAEPAAARRTLRSAGDRILLLMRRATYSEGGVREASASLRRLRKCASAVRRSFGVRRCFCAHTGRPSPSARTRAPQCRLEPVLRLTTMRGHFSAGSATPCWLMTISGLFSSVTAAPRPSRQPRGSVNQAGRARRCGVARASSDRATRRHLAEGRRQRAGGSPQNAASRGG